MREFKASTKRGQDIIAMGERCCWHSLHNLYDSWSQTKEHAYNYCYDLFAKDDNATAFGVDNANTFGFTASWLSKYEGEDVLRVETKDNSYLVWLER